MTTVVSRLAAVGARRREIALVAGAALAGILLTLAVVSAFDDDSPRQAVPAAEANSPALYVAPDAVVATPASWRAVAAESVTVGAGESAFGEPSATFDFSGARETFTIAQLTFDAPRDWSGRSFLFLELKGAASGTPYTFFIDFASDHGNSAAYTLVDTSDGWTVVPFELGTIVKGRTAADWGHVVSVRIATDSKDGSGSFELGGMRLSGAGP